MEREIGTVGGGGGGVSTLVGSGSGFGVFVLYSCAYTRNKQYNRLYIWIR